MDIKELPEIEQETLSIILRNGKATKELGELSPEDFVIPSHREIFEAIQEVSLETPVTEANLIDRLKARGNIRDNITSLILPLMTMAHIGKESLKYNIGKLREATALRRLDKCLKRQADKPIDNINEIENIKLELSQIQTEYFISTIEEEPYKSDRFLSDVKKIPEGLKTGYPDLDEYITIDPALTLICGRISHGKTTFMLNLLYNMVQKNDKKTFIYISFEEPRDILTLKFIQLLTANKVGRANNIYDLKDHLQNDNTKGTIEEALNEYDTYINEDRLRFEYAGRLDVELLQSRILTLIDKYNVGAVFIDYLQIIPYFDKSLNRYERIGYIATALKNIANLNKVPVICGAQLGRKEHKSEILRLNNIRESDNAGQECTLALMIWNETTYKGKDADKGVAFTDKVIPIEIHIKKNRYGIVNRMITLSYTGSNFKMETQKPEGLYNDSNK